VKRVRLPFLVVVTLAASCARQSAPPVILYLVRQAETCRVELDGHPVTQDQLLVAARSWRGRVVRIEYGKNTPYKCIGGTIFTVQRAGVEKVGFEPSPKE
jgi:hypothetical protein